MTVKSLGYWFPNALTTVTWDTVTGKPPSFPPSAHTHPWSDITGKPATYAPSAHTHLWADITDKPTTFAPSAHTHAIADVTGLQGALDAKLATANFTWGNLSGKPATFPPSAHTHLWADITDRPTVFALSTIAPLAGAATGVIGTSTMAAKADHQHPLQTTGVNTLVGTVTVGETAVLALNAGVRKVQISAPGVVVGGNYMLFPVSATPAGYALADVVATAADTLQVSLNAPLLALGASYSIPCRLVRVGT